MSRYGRWTEDRIKRYVKEGRGEGTGPTYRPWIEVGDFSSRGDSRRVFSRLTNRTHHLLSGIEFDFFVLAEFTPGIVDIREQYPLERDQTLSIAAAMGIKHPQYPSTNVDAVMTCDFLVTRERNGRQTHEVFNCKSIDEANDARSLEKLEIQRRYFDERDIPHFIVFDTMLPATKIRNIQWIRDGGLSEDEIEPHPGYYTDHSQRLLHDIVQHRRQVSLQDYTERYDERTGALPGTGLRVVRMLLAERLLVTDLNEPELHRAPLAMFKQSNTALRVAGAA